MNILSAKFFSIVGIVFCFVVIALGAWTRLEDAGLGCPDCHRLRRLVIYKDKEMFNQAENLRAKFPEVIFLYDEDNLFKKSISENLSDPYMSKSMFLVDSFALVVWEFNVNLSFSDIFEDLEKLL